jgi:hypothetical protein
MPVAIVSLQRHHLQEELLCHHPSHSAKQESLSNHSPRSHFALKLLLNKTKKLEPFLGTTLNNSTTLARKKNKGGKQSYGFIQIKKRMKLICSFLK